MNAAWVPISEIRRENARRLTAGRGCEVVRVMMLAPVRPRDWNGDAKKHPRARVGCFLLRYRMANIRRRVYQLPGGLSVSFRGDVAERAVPHAHDRAQQVREL